MGGKYAFADIYRLCCHIFVIEKERDAGGLNMCHLGTILAKLKDKNSLG